VTGTNRQVDDSSGSIEYLVREAAFLHVAAQVSHVPVKNP